MNKPTMKQLKTIEALPKTGYDIGKAMLKGGYTKASSRAGSNYQALRRVTQSIDAFNPDKIKERVMDTYKLAEAQKDITNMNRNLEHQAKIAGIIIDKKEVDNKNPDKVIIQWAKPEQSVDRSEVK